MTPADGRDHFRTSHHQVSKFRCSVWVWGGTCVLRMMIKWLYWVTFSYLCLAMFHDRYVVISYQNWNKVINLHKPAPAPAVEKQEIWHCRAWVLWLLWTEIKQGERRQLLRRLYCRLPGSSVFSLSIHFVCLALLVTQCLLRSRDTARF